MDTETALKFLRTHQCIPKDVNQSVIDSFDQVREFFIANPDERCIPLFLGAFEDHMGWGVFQLCDDVFRCYRQQLLDPHLKAALANKNKGVRWWAAHWAMEFNSANLTQELFELLERVKDEDAHYFALAALGDIFAKTRDMKVLAVLRERKGVETDSERLELLQEILGDMH